MRKKPIVSVTIPSYNHARFLPAAIESVLTQTYEPLEVVIVDDGSTDDSLQIAKDYATRHPDIIRVFTHAGNGNRGISATVNLGFEKSTGEYWSGLPSDDELHPHKIAEQVEFLEQHREIGWVYCYGSYINEDGVHLTQFDPFGEDITKHGEPVEQLILGNVVPGMSVLMRRSAVTEIEPHDEALVYSDWDFWVRMAARHRVAFMPRSRVRYRVQGSNTSFGMSRATNMGRAIEVMEKLRRTATRIGGPLARPRTQALIELQLTYYFYGTQREDEAQRHLGAAFTVDPTLAGDVRYLVRWLKHCRRDLLLLHDRPDEVDFENWVLRHLPASLDAGSATALSHAIKGWAFGSWAEKYFRIGGYFRGRRRLLKSLIRDPRARRERELLVTYLEGLVGSRVSARLRNLFKAVRLADKPNHDGALRP